LFARLLAEAVPASVVAVSQIEEVDATLATYPTFNAAVVDLSFAHQQGSGLDVLMAVSTASPSTKLIVLTTGDGWSIDLLEVAWDALDLATAISKTASVEHQIRVISQVLREGSAPVDGVLRANLPDQRSSNRSAASFRRLVRHRGHAKLWAALMQSSPAAEYAELASISGLSLNTLRNYRSDLLPELALHGLEAPTMAQMHAFSLLVRPLLQPYLQAAVAAE
jgi:DNA-binding NarL/FixJ family response regulator